MSDKLKNISDSSQKNNASARSAAKEAGAANTGSKAPIEASSAAPDDGVPDARLAPLDRFRHIDRVATLSRLASHIAHELGTPLNVIEAYALMMASGEVTGEAIQKNARIIAAQAGRMTTIIREMLTSMRRNPRDAEPVDLLSVAQAALSLTSVEGERRGVRLVLDPESQAAPMTGDAEKLLEVAMNLLLNGVQATPEGGTVTLAARLKHRPSAVLAKMGCPEDPNGPEVELATLEVRDEGAGIAKDSIAHIFKPFFTTKGASGGAGLGLSVAQGIVKDHGGWIEVESNVGRGSCFTVYLPLGAR